MSPSVDESASDGPREYVLQGTGVAPGIAIGTLYRYEVAPPEVDRTEIAPAEVEEEIALFDKALARAEMEIDQVRTIADRVLGEEEAAIVEAQRMMLHDDALLDPVRERIRTEHDSAAQALRTVLQGYRRRISESDDAYLRERTDDLLEVETRLLRALERGRTAIQIEPNAIVVADTLAATDLLRLHERGLLGCVTTGGGEHSHVSILARALHVPAVVGVEGELGAVETHRRAVIDGGDGRLIVNPSADTLEAYRKRRDRQKTLRADQARNASAPAATADGRPITVQANVEFEEELQILDEYGADGVGLMRTEMLFLSRPAEAFSEETQVSLYRRAARAAHPHAATVRLLDLGGDKPFSRGLQEPNPSLGWRGIRLLLDRPDELLRPQVRALLRANTAGNLRVLLPMVTQLEEVRRVQTVICEEADRLVQQGIPHDDDLQVGAMVEVPAVALQARAFAAATDFLSIGTNDLTQYVLAVDRDNDRVAEQYDPLHPAVLTLVRRATAAGRESDTPVVVCGEAAGDIHALPLLVGLGITGLSATPSYLPRLKRLIRHVSYPETSTLADAACDAPDAETVHRRVREWIAEHVDEEVIRGPDAISP